MVKRIRTSTSPSSTRVTTDEALQKVINVVIAESYRPRTIQDYRKIWKWFFDTINGELGAGIYFIDELTIDHFREYVTYCLMERELSPVTVNVRIRALKAIFNRLIKEGVITDNPTERLKKLKTDEKVLEVFSDDQFKRLLAAIDKSTFAGFRDYAAILLMYDAGLRVNEINSLEITDIDLENGVIMLPGAKNKNRKTRAVPVSTSMVGLLRQLIHETKEFFGSRIGRVFTNNNGEPLSEALLRKRMNEYGKKAGLNGVLRVSPHTLRHTFATKFLLNGGGIVHLQEILGHSDINTTKIYLTVKTEDIKRAHKRFSPLKNINVSDR